MHRIYLDHSATTPVGPLVFEAMRPYFMEVYGNPSSVHIPGREARTAIEEARSNIAKLIGAQESEIYFVSGGTEADNLAIKGIAYANRDRGNHIITTRVEHQAVLNSCRFLEKEGFQITYLDVDASGMVDPTDVKDALTARTILISIIHGNNEIGTINPIEEIGAIAAEAGVFFHTDAVQSFGKIPIDVNRLNLTLMSISSHKIYGPKGVGALYIRRGTPVGKLLHGGHHENNRRAGTENVPGIVGFSRASQLMHELMRSDRERIGALRNYFQERLQERIPDIHINGHPTQRLYHNLHCSFPGCESEALLLSLDIQGIAVSTGSACIAGSVEPSHVLKALGLPPILANSAIRFTLGRGNTREEIDSVVDVLEESVKRLRETSGYFSRRKKPVRDDF